MNNEYGWSSGTYDLWRTGHPEEWDEPELEEKPQKRWMGFSIGTEIDGMDASTFLMVEGECDSQEFYNGRIVSLDEDASVLFEVANPTRELWDLIDKTLRTRKYEWLDDTRPF